MPELSVASPSAASKSGDGYPVTGPVLSLPEIERFIRRHQSSPFRLADGEVPTLRGESIPIPEPTLTAPPTTDPPRAPALPVPATTLVIPGDTHAA